MKKKLLYRSAAILFLFMQFCGCIPAMAADTGIVLPRVALYDTLIPIEDDIGRDEPNEMTFSLLADETIDPYEQIHADFAWDYETYGNEVNVAVIDTGCAVHPALADTLKKNYYFKKVTDANGNTNDVMYATNASTDTNGHGTHVAGIIAAQLGNALNVKGIAPKVNLYTFNCTVETKPGEYAIHLGMAMATLEYAVHVLGCKVVNMSFGAPKIGTNPSYPSQGLGEEEIRSMHEDIRAIYEAGAILVASVGNDYNATRRYPAAFEEVIGVGSVNSKNARSSFSNTNDTVDVVAPGGDIKKENVAGSINEAIHSLHHQSFTTTAAKSGTSQAAPHVAGAAALMLSAKPDITPAEFKALLQNCSAKIHGEGYDATDGYGNGLLDVRSMFGALTNGQSCYIAPPSDGHIALFNLTDEDITTAKAAVTFLSEAGILQSCHTQAVTIGAQNTSRLQLTEGETAQRLFLWNFATMAPLAAARKIR